MVWFNLQFLSPFKYLLLKSQLHFAMEDKSQQEIRELPDAELFSELVAKKPGALSVLYDRYSPVLFGLAKRILNDQRLAEDVLQELFLFLWENPGKFSESRGNPLPWLTILCCNRCIDKLRRQQKRPRAILINEEIILNLVKDESASPFEIVNYNEVQKIITGALRKLPDEQRRPIEMAYFEGLSQTEIADALQAPLGTIKTRIRLALQKLHSLLQQTLK